MTFPTREYLVKNAPLAAALLAVALAGILLLNRADAQARDTVRKHHLEDIEHALYHVRDTHGTYPPYGETEWCGRLNQSENRAVRGEIEASLRARHEQYANPAKPFPTDPLSQNDYFYWKRSPAAFELFAVLEADPTADRDTSGCAALPARDYDYGLLSPHRDQG